MRSILLPAALAACLALAGHAAGQASPVLVADLTTSKFESQPVGGWLDVRADLAVFIGQTPAEGRELWATDGTSAGTRLIHATVAGPDSTLNGRPIRAGSRVFFTTIEGPRNWSLWSLDTQTLGVTLAKSFEGATNSIPRRWDALGDRRLFVASAIPGGDRILWTSDGTAAGTVPLRAGVAETGEVLDVAAGPAGAGVAVAATSGLLVTDGTPAGTRRVAVSLGSNTVVRAAWAGPDRLLALAAGGLAAYSVTLQSDQVRSIAAPSGGSPLAATPSGVYWINFGGQLVLMPPDPLVLPALVSPPAALGGGPITGLRSDGTRLLITTASRLVSLTGQSSELLADLAGTGGSLLAEAPSPVQGGLLFAVDVRGAPSPTGERRREWLLTDGTPAGTRRLNAPAEGRVQFNQSTPRVVGGRLVQTRGLRSAPGVRRSQVYAMGEGTAGADVLDEQTTPLTPEAFARPLGVVGGRLLVNITSDDRGSRIRAVEPTMVVEELADLPKPTDGTYVIGTVDVGNETIVLGQSVALGVFGARVDDAGNVSPAERLVPQASAVGEPYLVGGRAVFLVDEPQTGRQLWSSDGTAAGTTRVTTLSGGVGLGVGTVFGTIGQRLLFSGRANSGEPTRLYATDGRLAGEQPLLEGVADSFFSAQTLELSDGQGGRVLIFAVSRQTAPGQFRQDILRSDGTAAGTASLLPGPLQGTPFSLSPLPGAVYAARFSTAGSLLLREPYGGGSGMPAPAMPVLVNGVLLGMQTIASTANTTAFPSPSGMAAVDADLNITPLLPSAGFSRLDGPAATIGTGSLVAAVSFGGSVLPTDSELLLSDGTPQGTSIFETVPGPENGVPTDCFSAGRRVLFSAVSPGTGQELWSSDGTPAGTRLLADLRPGPRGSVPGSFFTRAGRVYFFASAAGTGSELHSLSACPADFAGDGAATVEDIFQFLSAWFAGRPGADVDGDGSQTVSDIFAFLNAWFSDC